MTWFRSALVVLLIAATVRSADEIELRDFSEAKLLETVSETTAGVSLGDLDGDGDLDLVLAKGRHWPLVDQVLLNDGQGGFAAAPLSRTSDRSYSGPLADLDGDGDLDLVISNDRPDAKAVYFNNGDGTFRPAGSFGDPQWTTRNVAVADLNGDQRPDIAVANRGRPNYVCLNDGRGGFADCAKLGDESTTTILAADIDGDSDIDLIVPHRDGGPSAVYLNDGSGSFPTTAAFAPTAAKTRAAAVADFDGDGRLDIAAAHEQMGLYIYFNRGGAAFSSGVQIVGIDALPYCLAAGDLNRDGRPELILAYVRAPGVIFFNRGDGREYLQRPFGDSNGTIYGMAIGDVDGDDFPDIAAARSDAPSVLLFNRAAR